MQLAADPLGLLRSPAQSLSVVHSTVQSLSEELVARHFVPHEHEELLEHEDQLSSQPWVVPPSEGPSFDEPELQAAPSRAVPITIATIAIDLFMGSLSASRGPRGIARKITDTSCRCGATIEQNPLNAV